MHLGAEIGEVLRLGAGSKAAPMAAGLFAQEPAQVWGRPWLLAACGLLLAGTGAYLLVRYLPMRLRHPHGHGHRHTPGEWGAAARAPGQRLFGLGPGASGHSPTRQLLPAVIGALLALAGVLLAASSLWRLGQPGFLFGSLFFHGISRQRLGPALLIAGLGLVLGVRHSTDADHVVAISTIVTRERSLRGASLIGALWGLGHTVTISIVGCLIILFGVVIPPRVGLSMEFSVALMLILLGLLNLTGVMQKVVARLSTGQQAAAAVAPPTGVKRGARAHYGLYQCLRPLVVGLVHGLAGSAAIALLVLSTIHNPSWALVYLVIFGVGTMLGMMCMTVAMSLPMVYAGDRLPQVSRYLGVASGVVSVCFGCFLVYQLGYLGGLFSSHPHWTPQ